MLAADEEWSEAREAAAPAPALAVSIAGVLRSATGSSVEWGEGSKYVERVDNKGTS